MLKRVKRKKKRKLLKKERRWRDQKRKKCEYELEKKKEGQKVAIDK